MILRVNQEELIAFKKQHEYCVFRLPKFCIDYSGGYSRQTSFATAIY